MAATLKLFLMSHFEDPFPYQSAKAVMYGKLCSAIGHSAVGAHGGSCVRGAKFSLQFGLGFLDGNDGYPLDDGSSLHMALEHGGNFWVQVHCTTYPHLRSTHACVMSAYQKENSLVPGPYQYSQTASVHVSGRSGGWGDGVDWASITVAKGMRRMNSTVMKSHCLVPDCLRPYGLDDDDLGDLYNHDAAPGPLDADVATMRLRPFWLDNSSCWFDKISSTLPSAANLGSIMMVPMPGRFSIHNKADRRSAYEGEPQITKADLDACLTEIWTCFQLMTAHQTSISNVWYSHFQPQKLEYLDDLGSLNMIADWVDSINEIMCVHSYGTSTPYAKWMNMNEICDCFSHTTSMYW